MAPAKPITEKKEKKARIEFAIAKIPIVGTGKIFASTIFNVIKLIASKTTLLIVKLKAPLMALLETVLIFN